MKSPKDLVRLPSDAAWRNIVKDNANARWGGTSSDPRWRDSAAHRLGLPIVLPSTHPRFHISGSDKIFCIGSCFARHIESALIDLGFTVPSRLSGLPTEDVLNKYNTFSMLNEMRWALDPENYPFPEDSLIREGTGVIDPHLSVGGLPRPAEDVLAIRRRVTEAMTRIKECRLVVLTLGLVETWYDVQVGVHLTEAPSFRACRRNPQRYELQISSYVENLRALEEIYDLISRCGHPDVKIVVTVSPVPFLATFSDDDVLTANTYSKATLRAVAGDFARNHLSVDYLPTFESVTNSDRNIAWEPDRIHVSKSLVSANILNFLANYLSGSDAIAMAARRERLLSTFGMGSQKAQADPISLPVFEVATDGEPAFPAGIPAVLASSEVSDELGPANLADGSIIPWHAAQPVAYPQTLQITFARPLRCIALWLQAQDRHPDRAPTGFVLYGEKKEAGWKQLLRVTTVKWQEGGQWQTWPIASASDYQCFRLEILSGGQPLLTLQRLWFQPA